MLDMIIRGGRIIDGLGTPSFSGDLGIKDGRIVEVAERIDRSAKQTVDADGLYVAPGFIDVHSHDDLAVLHDPFLLPKLQQGITTTIVGNCGLGPAPAADQPDLREALRKYVEPVLGDWEPKEQSRERGFGFSLVSDYVRAVTETKHALNVAVLIAHGSLRIAVMGFTDREATEGEIRQMQSLIAEAMKSGALGMSLGLMYAPGCFSTRHELIELAKEVARHGGMLTTHIRGEGDLLIPSIKEMIDIGREADLPVHISHLKSVGIRNWGKLKQAIDVISQARNQGLDVTCDAYPYTAGSTTITSLLPPWALQGGVEEALKRINDPDARERISQELGQPGTTWDNVAYLTGFDRIVLASSAIDILKSYEGQSFDQIGQKMDCSPLDAYLNVLQIGGGDETIVVHHMSEQDLQEVLKFQYASFGSDGLPLREGHPHPRLYGTFPRLLAKYVREEKLMDLEEAVRKMTSLSARRFHLSDRGQITRGYVADLVVFDPEQTRDAATYEHPRQFADGIEYVIVSGQVVLHRKQCTNELPGMLLKRGSAAPSSS